ncbi:MAG: hypothetical protein A3F84_25635 [Candidatus Handelsmanbacteria bacterium RIFCSPLOWO2_12_FULL_64_10]|uniref:Cohesin domain-containing protein n=1 Tax=Handelsmanbacteria sp. (strain RIFCSPLOWO2_12_FULL_64_10) TaxID=1817868 RepID=A0A1F6CHV2_HANXR|nr:MAG: hypothetical protein A3F84_25635 [Candidatus Handelsmanbacteria bacterium RIFCSPLOWO2_12_FULL_64_10]
MLSYWCKKLVFVGFLSACCVLAFLVPAIAGPNIAATFTADLDPTDGDQGQHARATKPGDDIEIEVYAKKIASANGATISVQFDPAQIQFVTFMPGVQGFIPLTQTEQNVVTVGGALLGATFSGDVLLGTLNFRALPTFKEAMFTIREIVINAPGAVKDTFNTNIVLTAGKEIVEATPGDINRDGKVDFEDFFILASNFGKTGPKPTDAIRIVTQTVTVRDTVVVTKTVRDTIRISGATSGTRYVYSFDSASEITNWLKRDTGTSRVEAGKLILGSMSGKGMTIYPLRIFTGDIDVEVATEWKSGVDNHGFGIEFKGSQKGVYVFLITGNGAYKVSKWSSANPDNWIDLVTWTQSSLINSGH